MAPSPLQISEVRFHESSVCVSIKCVGRALLRRIRFGKLDLAEAEALVWIDCDPCDPLSHNASVVCDEEQAAIPLVAEVELALNQTQLNPSDPRHRGRPREHARAHVLALATHTCPP